MCLSVFHIKWDISLRMWESLFRLWLLKPTEVLCPVCYFYSSEIQFWVQDSLLLGFLGDFSSGSVNWSSCFLRTYSASRFHIHMQFCPYQQRHRSQFKWFLQKCSYHTMNFVSCSNFIKMLVSLLLSLFPPLSPSLYLPHAFLYHLKNM